jgi:hypothetical protein
VGLDKDHSVALHDWSVSGPLLRLFCARLRLFPLSLPCAFTHTNQECRNWYSNALHLCPYSSDVSPFPPFPPNRETGRLIASGLGHQNNVLGLAVCPDGQGVVIVGQRFVRFLRVEGRALKSSAGVLGKLGVVQVTATQMLEKREPRSHLWPGTKVAESNQSDGRFIICEITPRAAGSLVCVAVVLQAFTSVAFLGEDAIVGTSGGQLYRFQDRSLIQVVQAHGLNEPVLSLVGMGAERRQVMSGGRDGLIGTWDAQLKPLGSPLDLTASNVTERSREGGVGGDMAVVAVHALGREGYVVAGTRGGQVIELQTTQQGGLQARLLINAHAAGELWGLDSHPSKSEYATAGEGESRSRTIIEHREWRIENHGRAWWKGDPVLKALAQPHTCRQNPSPKSRRHMTRF